MAEKPPVEIKDIEWALSLDGKYIQLTFTAGSGEKMVSRMSDEGFTGFLTMLINVGVLSAEKSAGPAPEVRTIRADPIPVSQVSIGAGRTAQEVVLTVRTGMMELLFAVDPRILLDALHRLEAMTSPPLAPGGED